MTDYDWVEERERAEMAYDEAVAEGRRNAAREILARARALQADVDGDPDLAADPMVAGEVEGLWSAVRIADRETWEEARGRG